MHHESIVIEYNRLASPDGYDSLLLVRQGARAIRIIRCDHEFIVLTRVQSADDPTQSTRENFWCKSLDEAAARAWKVVEGLTH